jgi:gliding motility-associated-like protein
MKDNLQDIEKLFRESLDGLEMDVDPNVWSNISNQIGSASPSQDPSSVSNSGTGSSGISGGIGTGVSVAKIAVLAVTAGILSIGSYMIFGNNEEEVTPAQEVVKEKVIVDEQVDQPVITIQEEEKTDVQVEVVTTEIPQEKITEETGKIVIAKRTNTEIGEGLANGDQDVKVDDTRSQPKENSEEKQKPSPVQANTKPAHKAVVPAESREKEIESRDIFEASIYASINNGKLPLEVSFENRGTYSDDILWKFRDGDVSRSHSTSHTFEKSGDYWVILEIKDSKGRMSVDSVKITVGGKAYLKAPNTFTPNGDGINDAFVIESESVSTLSCQIFDRNQHLIFKWNSIHGHWDGRDMNGNIVPAGTYFYVIEAEDENGNSMDMTKGIVTLFR